MKKLDLTYISVINKKSPFTEISAILDLQERNVIQMVPWPRFHYKPDVSFAIGYHDDCIFIKYFVKESSIRIVHRKSNAPVYEDSCVEFFISFGEEEAYYNFEFNCIGTCLLGFGNGKTERALLPEEYISRIRHHSIIDSTNNADITLFEWELTVVIPSEVFIFHNIPSLKGMHCKVNFFKCGDELAEPHFLAWNDITAASPNFHLPEFFGLMHFA